MPPDKDSRLNILLADDDGDDRFIFSYAVKHLDRDINLTTVEDGEELLFWLQNQSIILPDILFLDLNMPRMGGLECLDEIRSNPQLQHIFVAIYTTSTSLNDVQAAYEKGANLFINKPNSFDDLTRLLKQVFETDLKTRETIPTKEEFIALSLVPKDTDFTV